MSTTSHMITSNTAAPSQANPVVRGILDYLRERQLQPGDRLPSERALAEKLGVGRNALREALVTLSTLRIVEARPNSGIYLRRVSSESSFETLVLLAEMGEKPTSGEILETMEVRSTLELLAVKLACERADEADFQRMANVLAQTDAVLEARGNIAEADTAFHLALLEAAHNGVLVRVLNAFYRITSPRRHALFGNEDQGRKSAQDHRELFEAVRARNVERAQELITRHMERARMYWNEVLGEQ